MARLWQAVCDIFPQSQTILTGLIIGFIAGLAVNWVFGMISRLLPPTSVRYAVHLGGVEEKQNLSSFTQVIQVAVSPPRWKRILMEPIREYLVIEVRIDSSMWIQSKWDEGDNGIYRLRADAAMAVYGIVLTTSPDGRVYLADKFLEPKYEIKDYPHKIGVRIVRSIDKEIAAEAIVPYPIQHF